MKHIIVLLVLGLGAYAAWQLMGNAARVNTKIFLGQHLFKIILIIAVVQVLFAMQALFGSAKLF